MQVDNIIGITCCAAVIPLVTGHLPVTVAILAIGAIIVHAKLYWRK